MNIFQKEVITLDHLPLAADVTVVVGSCLKMGEGGLVLCGAADKPEYISNTNATGDGSVIPVDKVTPETVLVGELAADCAGITVGGKLQLAANSVDISATEGGCLEVHSFEGTTAGSKVLVVAK